MRPTEPHLVQDLVGEPAASYAPPELLELSKYILQAVYEATGQNGTAVDVMSTLLRRWPGLPPDDVRAHLGSLASQGLIAIRGDGVGAITSHGIRVLSQLWESGAFGGVQAQAPATRENSEEVIELAQRRAQAQTVQAAQAQAQAAQAQASAQAQAYGGSGWGQATPSPNAGHTPVPFARIQRLRQELDALTQELSAATHLPMNEWSQALEITSQVEGLLDALERLLNSPGE